jgi:hypothetical protein
MANCTGPRGWERTKQVWRDTRKVPKRRRGGRRDGLRCRRTLLACSRCGSLVLGRGGRCVRPTRRDQALRMKIIPLFTNCLEEAFSEIRDWSLGPCSGCLRLAYSTRVARPYANRVRREDRRYENAKPRLRRGRTTLCCTHSRAAPATWGTHHSVLRWRCAGREEP